ncbi:hypothetical protein LTR84_003518 [Exophiala bonariae]|uniref:Inner kinetochore subunit AME1 domain-containing protein n=1 Tax=Exophiala bonariae TaxID=1690606 RepID=A0AAV9N7I2_9EURO|nr:hypothetical protein LTR84_003518 [Exophiala bonariae]
MILLSRQIAGADFGLDFGMGNDRQERQQMRQRGAGVRSSKRRRLSLANDQTPTLSRASATSASVRTTRSSSRKESSIFAIAEDDELEVDESSTPRNIERPASAASVPKTVANEHDPEKENAFAGRREVDLNATPDPATLFFKTKTVQEPDLESNPPEFGEDDLVIEHDTAPLSQPNPEPEVEADIQPQVLLASEPEVVAAKSSRPQKRKRRSVVGARKKKRHSNESNISAATDAGFIQNAELQDLSENLAEPSLLEQGNEESAVDRDPEPSRLRRIAPRRDFTPEADEEDGDETYIQDASPEPPTPAPPKKTTKRRIHQQEPSQVEGRRRGKTPMPTFPVLTHRMTKVSALSTVQENADEDGHAVDSGRATPTLPLERSQPNVVDVLAQICRETIANLINSMSQNTRSADRTAIKTKRAAFKAFGEDLDEELFQMSEAVENRIELEARVRKSKREKAGLQAEYSEIRKQREQIALKCDLVRRRHWDCEQDVREKWNISETARRVELDVERNEEEVDEGIEFLLRSVANDVSNSSDAGGILDRTKAFNAQLEMMALMLERRQS